MEEGPFAPLKTHLASFPEIKDLSESIFSRLCPQTGASLKKVQELQSLEKRLEESRRRYLEAKLISNALKDLFLFSDQEEQDKKGVREFLLLGRAPHIQSPISPLSISLHLPPLPTHTSKFQISLRSPPLLLLNNSTLQKDAIIQEAIRVYSSLIQKYLSSASHERNEVEYIRLKLLTFHAKAEMTQNRILSDIYEPQSLQALQKMLKVFSTRLKEQKEAKRETLRSLEQYAHVDHRFNDVLETYVRLKSEISVKEWAVKNIQK